MKLNMIITYKSWITFAVIGSMLIYIIKCLYFILFYLDLFHFQPLLPPSSSHRRNLDRANSACPSTVDSGHGQSLDGDMLMGSLLATGIYIYIYIYIYICKYKYITIMKQRYYHFAPVEK